MATASQPEYLSLPHRSGGSEYNIGWVTSRRDTARPVVLGLEGSPACDFPQLQAGEERVFQVLLGV